MQLANDMGIKKIVELGSGKFLLVLQKECWKMFQRNVMKIQKILRI